MITRFTILIVLCIHVMDMNEMPMENVFYIFIAAIVLAAIDVLIGTK